MSNHANFTGVHRPYAAVYADAAARTAATGFPRGFGGAIEAFAAADQYKAALQLDNATVWVLTNHSPITWVQTTVTLANDSVSNAMLANMATQTIKGRTTAGTGDPEDLTAAQATAILNAMVGDSGAGGTKGLAPAPAAGDAAAGKFLSAAGTYDVPPGSGAPTGATYITQTPSAGLSAEQAMSALATGLVKNTTTTGVQSIADVGDVSAPVFAADAGSNDTYVATLSPAPAAYVTGVHYRFKANTANTGACTINFNGLGAKTIKKAAGGITTDLADNDIRAGQWVDLVYDGTNMQMQSTLGNAAGGGISGLTTNTIPKAASSTTLTDSPLTDDSTTIAFGNRLVKTNQIYNGSISTVGAIDFYLDRFVGLRLGADVTGFGFNDAYFDNVGRHSGFLRIVSTATGGFGTLVHPPRTYTQFTANQNDFDISDNYWLRWSSDASRDVTGMRAINDAFSGRQADGEEHLIVNAGTNDIVLKHESASSTATNRFLCSTGADITLSANQAADVIYDGTTQRWRVFKRN